MAANLEDMGWSVWWDQVIPAGETWASYIKQQLDEARSVVVLWSSNSVESEWVAKEARYGAKKKILVPARIEAVEPPLEFEEFQAANLVGWDGGQSDAFKQFVSGITRRVSPPVGPGRQASGPTPAEDFAEEEMRHTEDRPPTRPQIYEPSDAQRILYDPVRAALEKLTKAGAFAPSVVVVAVVVYFASSCPLP